MNNTLIERVARCLGNNVHDGFYRPNANAAWYPFDPKNDNDLLVKCLEELLAANSVMLQLFNGVYLIGHLEITVQSETLKEAVLTAWCELQENK